MLNKKIVILGLGDIAGGYNEKFLSKKSLTHAMAIKKNKNLKLMGCMDINSEALNNFSNFWKIKNSYNQVRDIEKDFYDVVVISSPSSCHTDQLFEALELKPKVILVEKPLTLTKSDYRKIQQLPKENNICVNYLRNWDPKVQELKNHIIDDNYQGYFECKFNGSIMNAGSHMISLLFDIFDNLQIDRKIKSKNHDLFVLNTKNELNLNLIHFKENLNYQLFELSYTSKNSFYKMACNGKYWHSRKMIKDKDYPDLSYLDPHYKMEKGHLTECLDYVYLNIANFLEGKEKLKNNLSQSLKAEKLCRDLISWKEKK